MPSRYRVMVEESNGNQYALRDFKTRECAEEYAQIMQERDVRRSFYVLAVYEEEAV